MLRFCFFKYLTPNVTAYIRQRVYIEKHLFSLKATAPWSRLFVTWHLIVVVLIFFISQFLLSLRKKCIYEPSTKLTVEYFLYKQYDSLYTFFFFLYSVYSLHDFKCIT
jgi:hypothetical protein